MPRGGDWSAKGSADHVECVVRAHSVWPQRTVTALSVVLRDAVLYIYISALVLVQDQIRVHFSVLQDSCGSGLEFVKAPFICFLNILIYSPY